MNILIDIFSSELAKWLPLILVKCNCFQSRIPQKSTALIGIIACKSNKIGMSPNVIYFHNLLGRAGKRPGKVDEGQSLYCPKSFLSSLIGACGIDKLFLAQRLLCFFKQIESSNIKL